MMVNKRFFSLILAMCMLAAMFTPAAAIKPEMWQVTFITDPFPVADCEPYGFDFWIWAVVEETDTVHWKLNQDGSLKEVLTNARMTHTFTTVPDQGKSLSANTQTNVHLDDDDFENNTFDFRGIYQKIVIPGVGPIFHDAGHKIFYYSWNDDGTLSFDLIFNAGPSTYTSNEFSALCAALAP